MNYIDFLRLLNAVLASSGIIPFSLLVYLVSRDSETNVWAKAVKYILMSCFLIAVVSAGISAYLSMGLYTRFGYYTVSQELFNIRNLLFNLMLFVMGWGFLVVRLLRDRQG